MLGSMKNRHSTPCGACGSAMARESIALEKKHPRSPVKFTAVVPGRRCDRCGGVALDNPTDQATFNIRCAQLEPEYELRPGRIHSGGIITVVSLFILARRHHRREGYPQSADSGQVSASKGFAVTSASPRHVPTGRQVFTSRW